MKKPKSQASRVGLTILSATLVLAGCAIHGPRIKEGQPVKGAVGKVQSLSQGWRQEEQQLFYFTTQGSQLLPYDWFLALEQPGNTNLFRSDENMDRLGWLLSRPTQLNPDALPVGFVKDVDDETKRSYLGLTCAACHTEQIKYREVTLRIDGGPTMADADGFITGLTRAMEETLGTQDKFDRFAHAVLRDKYNEAAVRKLRLELKSVAGYLDARAERNSPHPPYGHGRLDAFGNILNEVLAYALNIQTNARAADAPVSYPFLWDTPQSDRVQWNGVAQNHPQEVPPGLGPLGRNVGEVLGVFGKFEIQPTVIPTGYRSSVKMVNLGHLERWVAGLWSPQWPEKFLPGLDMAKVKRGEAIYNRPDANQNSCATCHEVIIRDDPKRRFNVKMTPLEIVGTDPAMASNFVSRVAATGRLEGKPIGGLFDPKVFGKTASGGVILNSVGGGVILHKPLEAALGAFEGDVHAFDDPSESLLAYKARPLNGIWATAPYLHNGSVPNLWELLKPPGDRMKSFYIGSREFDPVNVGFVTIQYDDRAMPMDITLPGNSNAGHTWGTELTDAEKRDLIEYLKSL
jgi:hypothetical protein